VRAAVKDTFGNPQIDSPVAFALPEALSAIRDNEAVDSSDMATGSDGTVVLSMTSTTPGTFTVTGSLLSGDVIGDGASVEFKPVADSGGTEPSPDPDNPQPGLEPGYDPDPGADLSPSPQPSSGDHLSNTGSNILIAAIAVLVLVAVGGTIVIIRKRRNQVLFGEVSN
jgi:hypothetical protein